MKTKYDGKEKYAVKTTLRSIMCKPQHDLFYPLIEQDVRVVSEVMILYSRYVGFKLQNIIATDRNHMQFFEKFDQSAMMELLNELL